MGLSAVALAMAAMTGKGGLEGAERAIEGGTGQPGSAGVVRVEDSGGKRFPIPGPRVTVAQQALPRERTGSVAVVREYLCDGGRRRAKR